MRHKRQMPEKSCDVSATDSSSPDIETTKRPDETAGANEDYPVVKYRLDIEHDIVILIVSAFDDQ